MKDLLLGRLTIVALGLAPALLWAAPKSQEPYSIHPSTQTVQRRQAVLLLEQSKDPQAGQKLIEALNDKDAMTRSLAAEGLGALKSAAAGSALAKVLAKDASPDVRQAAAVSLRQIQDPGAVDALGRALKDSSANVRLTALSGLGFYRDAKSGPLVEAVCTDPSIEVRRTAVYVLGRLEDRAAVPTVQQLIKSDPDAGVRAGAAQVLGQLRSKESVDVLRPLLKDPVKAIRASAAHSLLMLGEASGLAEASALDKDPDATVRLIAIDALGWSKDPAAEAELKTLLTTVPADSQAAIQAALNRTQQLRKKPSVRS